MAKDKSTKKKLITPIFRLSFPNLKEARAGGKDGTGAKKFGVQAIWDKSKFSDADKDRWRAILAELNRVSMEKFKKEWKNLPSSFKKGIRDGEDKDDMEGYGPGKKFASLTSNTRPGAVSNVKDDDGKFEKVDLLEESDMFYPGCYCRATVNAYAYDQNGGRGVALGLQNIQFVKDGPRLDARTKAEDDFDEDIDSQWIDEDEDDEDRPAKSKKKKSRDEDEDEDDRPKKKKKSRDEDDEDDEDERPRKKKPRDEDEDDEEDERPKKKKSRRDEEEDEDDEDDRPKKKKKSRRDEEDEDDDF